jgi:hypothetical protein
MAAKLDLPLDSSTVQALQHLGRDLIHDQRKREAFLKDRATVAHSYGIRDLDLTRLDERVVNLLADPEFHRAVEGRDFNGVREFVHQKLTAGGGPTGQLAREGTFDFDFDFEFEVEVVAVAVAVFDFAAAPANVPDEAELTRRRQIVAQAFQALGKNVAPAGGGAAHPTGGAHRS